MFVHPAIECASQGFVVRPQVHNWWSTGAILGRVDVTQRLGLTPSGRQLYFREDGTLRKIGDRITNIDLARTLQRIADHGHEIFYRGEIAQEIAADMTAHGGMLSLQDLGQYQTTRIDPLKGSYRDLDISTNHPPGGGIMLVEMLNILENFDLRALGHNSTEYLRTVCEAMKAATVDKEMFVGDPNFVPVPVDRLISKAHAATLADRIQGGEQINVERLKPDEPPRHNPCGGYRQAG